MLTDICPVRWTGRHAVIALPEHIDVSNAGPIREELIGWIVGAKSPPCGDSGHGAGGRSV